MRIKTAAANRKLNPNNVSGKGHSISGAIEEPPVMLIDWPWCKVRHHSTE